MTWILHRWVWQLKAPLFVGMSPAGSLNRCRPYVPARAIWGAITAELSRSQSGESFPKYRELGTEISSNCRFTNLYPAEKQDGKFLAWTPRFENEKGLQWNCYDNNEVLQDRIFRHRLLGSRPGTAIDPKSYSASEGTLRETECINPWWRSSNSPEDRKAMFLLGYVFVKKNFSLNLDKIDTLFIGGDTRYGLGKICRVGRPENLDNLSIFGQKVRLNGAEPKVNSRIIFGHALDNREGKKIEMQGAKELLGGWDQGSPWRGVLTWAPGSHLEKEATWSIDNEGYWKYQENN